MHDEVKAFYLEGQIREKNLEQEKARLEEYFTKSIRDESYVPVLDIDPHWTLNYNFATSTYDFKLTIYAVFEEDAWLYAGMMDGKLITSSLPKRK